MASDEHLQSTRYSTSFKNARLLTWAPGLQTDPKARVAAAAILLHSSAQKANKRKSGCSSHIYEKEYLRVKSCLSLFKPHRSIEPRYLAAADLGSYM
eukprot:scaffold73604_cov13-Tisochrysis_lutea.AAC.1